MFIPLWEDLFKIFFWNKEYNEHWIFSMNMFEIFFFKIFLNFSPKYFLKVNDFFLQHFHSSNFNFKVLDKSSSVFWFPSTGSPLSQPSVNLKVLSLKSPKGEHSNFYAIKISNSSIRSPPPLYLSKWWATSQKHWWEWNETRNTLKSQRNRQMCEVHSTFF